MRLIDADALNETLEKCKDNYRQFSYGDMNMCDAIDIAEQYVEYAPTVDAEPVRHGHWTEVSSFIGDYFDFSIVQKRCSVCRKWSGLAHTSNKDAFTFCPNCGAKMDGGAE